MLIIVSTLVSLLHPVLSAMSGALRWQGLEHWFFLLGLRLLALYFASSPWESARDDLACAWNRSQEEENRRFCTSVCYNRHFLDPVTATWGFSFLIALLPITIMRMLYPQEDCQGQGGQEDMASTRSNVAAGHRLVGESNMATKPKLAGESNPAAKSNMAAEPRPVGDSNMAATPKLVDTTNMAPKDNTVGLSGVTGPPAGPNMAAQPPWCAGVITMCIAVLLATEVGFLWALLARQLPMVSEPTFPCFPGTPACPPALECTIWGQADKRMALGSLALTACVSILVCLGSGGVWLGRATCCRGRQDGEQAPEWGQMREGSGCWKEWGEGKMGEGRVLRGDWEGGEFGGGTGKRVYWEGKAGYGEQQAGNWRMRGGKVGPRNGGYSEERGGSEERGRLRKGEC
ncbi:uncharacterized protein LOC122172916 [Chrysemys picta bellii]|uniref:uncharacterized protein LOC122172916 n=1 Tax=Chrysemys picta bellii TaxID=8478 RepID=UPI0032B1187C